MRLHAWFEITLGNPVLFLDFGPVASIALPARSRSTASTRTRWAGLDWHAAKLVLTLLEGRFREAWFCCARSNEGASDRSLSPPCEGGAGGVMREPWKSRTILLASREGCERTERERAWEDLVTGRAGTTPLSRDMTFDREIPTPGLIESQHRYSMGMVGFMEMLLRGFIMPRPIPVPIRQAMFRLWQKGYGTRQIAESLGLPCSTVRRLLQRFRLHGTDGLSPDYWHPSVPEAAPSDLVETAVSLRREHPTWGAGLIRVQLLLEAPGRPVPSERTLQRWFVRADQSPAPAGRPPRTHLDRATAPHET